MMYAINAVEIERNKEVNIWDLTFFTTSATEDNDTDEDQTEGRKKEYLRLHHNEQEQVELNWKKRRAYFNREIIPVVPSTEELKERQDGEKKS